MSSGAYQSRSGGTPLLLSVKGDISMIVGTTLFKLDGTAYYSPEFPRGGLSATMAAHVTHVEGSPTFGITIEERNEDETSFTTNDSFSGITSAGNVQKDVSSLKEIIRFKYSFDAGDQATDAVHFMMQAPSWRPY